MRCCSSTKQAEKVLLDRSKLEPIKINLDGPVIKFDPIIGEFVVFENPYLDKEKEERKLIKIRGEIEEIEMRLQSKLQLKQEISNSLDKLKTDKENLTEMLRCDLLDKEYLENIKEHIGDYFDKLQQAQMELEKERECKSLSEKSVSIRNEEEIILENNSSRKDDNEARNQVKQKEEKQIDDVEDIILEENADKIENNNEHIKSENDHIDIEIVEDPEKNNVNNE